MSAPLAATSVSASAPSAWRRFEAPAMTDPASASAASAWAARRQDVVHRDAVTALSAVVFTCRRRAALQELDELVGSDVWQTRLDHRLIALLGRPSGHGP